MAESTVASSQKTHCIVKEELRRVLREKAKQHSPEERRAASLKLCEVIRRDGIWKKANTILMFSPMAQEPDISCLLAEGLAAKKIVALPAWCADDAQYRALQVTNPQTDLAPGQFGIHEPGPHCAVLSLRQLDLILVPGVAFAKNGARLGRGKGFYDRLLARTTALKCGVAFDWQIIDNIPADSHDVLMDYLATPSETVAIGL